MVFVLFTVSLVNGMASNNHVITGAGKPSAEHDKFTVAPMNASTLRGTVINCGVTKQKHLQCNKDAKYNTVYVVLIEGHKFTDFAVSLMSTKF